MNTLQHLLDEIAFKRKKDLRNVVPAAYHEHHSTTYWTDLFVRHFLFQTDYEVDRDDLLFFVRKHSPDGSIVEVFRRDSRKLPIGDPDVHWEETIYLNLIVHQLDFTLTLAVCSRTSPKDLQVLRRFSQKVYATPSRRKMDSKGDSEEITYPHICFSVDNFDQMFDELLVRDGESLGIELSANDPHRMIIDTVLFSASVPYEAIKRVYDSRASQTVRKKLMSNSNLFSLFSSAAFGRSGHNRRIEYVQLIGTHVMSGHAEMAVAKVKEYDGCDTPSSEPGMDLLDLYDLEWDEQQPVVPVPYHNGQPQQIVGWRKTHHRRLSDPSSNLQDFISMGSNKLRASSESEGMNTCGDATCQIMAGDLLDELEEAKYTPLWTMRGYTQIFHTWRESRRLQSVPMQALLTYITLPWWDIISNLLEHPRPPRLTF